MAEYPLVSVVIPHFNGREILRANLAALVATTYPHMEVIVVDNASTDKSTDGLEAEFDTVRVVRNPVNTGYAGGCNAGFAVSTGELVLFLNNDTTFAPDWLAPLVQRMCSDERIAAVQPKLLAHGSSGFFDYSGAAGGLMDVFGFPFALGRIFFSLEKDAHQYDVSRDIFWASGTALLVRRSALQRVGVFDEDFFAHMEEIDLNWRFHLAGLRVVSEPASVVLHSSGSTLAADSFLKMYLNHRNSVIMLLKNYSAKTLLWVLPVRLLLEAVTVVFSLLRFDLRRVRAVVAAFGAVLLRLPATLRKRSAVQKLRCAPDPEILRKLYRGSIVFQYFVRRKTRVGELGLQ